MAAEWGLTKVALVGVVAGQALHGTQIGLERLMGLLLQSLLHTQQSLSQQHMAARLDLALHR